MAGPHWPEDCVHALTRSDRARRLAWALVVQAQQWDKGKGQRRERRRHQDQRVEMTVKSLLVEVRADIVRECAREIGDRHQSSKSKALRSLRTVIGRECQGRDKRDHSGGAAEEIRLY